MCSDLNFRKTKILRFNIYLVFIVSWAQCYIFHIHYIIKFNVYEIGTITRPVDRLIKNKEDN